MQRYATAPEVGDQTTLWPSADRAAPHPSGIWEVDFGHRRRVRDVRKFEYGVETLPSSMFGAPYRHAIDKVSARESQLRTFIERHYQE